MSDYFLAAIAQNDINRCKVEAKAMKNCKWRPIAEALFRTNSTKFNLYNAILPYMDMYGLFHGLRFITDNHVEILDIVGRLHPKLDLYWFHFNFVHRAITSKNTKILDIMLVHQVFQSQLIPGIFEDSDTVRLSLIHI